MHVYCIWGKDLLPERVFLEQSLYWGGIVHAGRVSMMSAILLSILTLAAIGWVLRVNARDRKLLEKELEEEFGVGSDR